MASNSFGNLFRITTYGESHGPAIGVIIDGCPAGLEIEEKQIHRELLRRVPGQSSIVTQRKEKDKPIILSGIFDGKTTGTPIHIQIQNTNAKSRDYEHIKDNFRPSHADFTYETKYGNRDYRGGGRSSARETANWVAAGAVARQLLLQDNIRIDAWVTQIAELKIEDNTIIDKDKIEDNIVRCPVPELAEKIITLIKKARKDGDTLGGIISCSVTGVPVGLGDPIFEKLHANLAKAMMSINASRGFEIGSGFRSATMRGSDHNDAFYTDQDQVKTHTNHSGGVQGGISNGMPIEFRVAFKPVATLMKDQQSVDKFNKSSTVVGKGRHDPCVLPRAVPIVEAMTALVLADHLLISRAYQNQ